MSGTTLRFIIAGVLCFHGIGHLMGVIRALGIIKTEASSPAWLKGWSSHSWLLTNLLGKGVSRVLCAILFLVALAATFATVLALMGWGIPHDAWRTLAIVSAIISLITIVLYWNALIFFMPHKVGALGVDIAILVSLLALNWPTETAIGW